MKKDIWRIFKVGGNPDREAFLADELEREILELQEYDWNIERIDCNRISRAWSMDKQKYVETLQYIIVAKTGEYHENDNV